LIIFPHYHSLAVNKSDNHGAEEKGDWTKQFAVGDAVSKLTGLETRELRKPWRGGVK